jgi:hypothetical protein
MSGAVGGSRRLPLGLVVVVVLVVVGLAAAMLARDDGRGAAAPAPTVAARVVGSGAVVSPVGPSGSRDGVPTGWRHDVAGAEEAAVGYVAVTGLAARSGPLTRRDMVLLLATEGYGPLLADQVSGQLSDLLYRLGERGLAPAGMVLVEYPLSVRSEPEGPDRVRVWVWSVTVFAAASGSVPRQLWRSSELVLVWERGDWKVDGWKAKEGPAPALGGEGRAGDVGAVSDVAGWRPVTGVGGQR